MNNKLDYNECIKYAEAIPGAEHTRLRGLESLENEKDCKVCGFGEKPEGTSILLSVKRDENGMLKSYFSTGNNAHALIIGSSGSGKSQGYGMNTLMNLSGKESYLCADIKGEYYQSTYSRLVEVYGKEYVKTINFMQPEYTDYHINYLCALAKKYLRGLKKRDADSDKLFAEVVEEVRKYIDILFIVECERDPSWETVAKSFIEAIVIALFEDLTLSAREAKRTNRIRTTPEMINFANVYRIFHTFAWSAQGSSFSDGGFFTKRNHSDLSYQYASPVINNASSTRACYMGFVENYLKTIYNPRIEAISSSDDFDIENMGKTPMIVFFIYDISDEAQREFVNKVFAQNVNFLLESTHKKAKPLKVPVIFYLDEFPTLRPNPVYPNVLATGRGSNIFLRMVIQSYTQLESRYPQDYKAMIENCDYTYFIGTNDSQTAAKFSDELGRTTVPNPVDYLKGAFSTVTVPVVSQDYLMHRMEDGETYIKIHRKQPIHGFFEFYYKTNEYNKYFLRKESVTPKTQVNSIYKAPWMENEDDDDIFDFLNDDSLSSNKSKYLKRRRTPYDSIDTSTFKGLADMLSGNDDFDYSRLYSEEFDIQSAISATPNIDDLALEIMLRSPEENLDETYSSSAFEEKYEEIIKQIMKMNKNWEREDALSEAAKEYAAVERFQQCDRALKVHLRVVYEFQTVTDEEYIDLRNQLFEDDDE